MPSDFIETFLEETNDIPSPKIYRLWAAITAISGALERKVWTAGSAGPIFPHLFTILVGPPASGKTNAIKRIRDLWAKVPSLKIGADSVTKAAMVDMLANSLRTEMDGSSIMSFSATNICCSEFGVFFVHHDTEFLSFINHIYDCPPIYREERRTAGIIEITKPHLVLLAGTQPDFLSSFMPEEAWGMGFTSRLNLVYCGEAPLVDMFEDVNAKKAESTLSLLDIHKLKGPMQWTDRAKAEMNAWKRAGLPPAPTHNKLQHYNGRRDLHCIKLSMLAAVSRSCELVVDLEDLERAQEWLLQAEAVMPDVFHAMSQKSDSQIINDLHFYLYQLWARTGRGKRDAIQAEVVYEYLKDRVPSDKIEKIIQIAEKTGSIRQGEYPGTWVPRPIIEMTGS